MKKIPYLFIIIGIGLIAYPLVSLFYRDYQESRLMSDVDRLFSDALVEEEVYTEAMGNSFQQLNSSFDSYYENPEQRSSLEELEGQEPELRLDELEKPAEVKNEGDIVGKIKIPAIEVNLPILYGASARILDQGAGQVPHTSPPGEIGNTGIAAHRTWTHGRLFNRLDEVNLGDEIILETYEGTFTYEVYDIKVVDPDDVTVLYRNSTHRVVTLITCTPMYDATHRLIVHGVMVDSSQN